MPPAHNAPVVWSAMAPVSIGGYLLRTNEWGEYVAHNLDPKAGVNCGYCYVCSFPGGGTQRHSFGAERTGQHSTEDSTAQHRAEQSRAEHSTAQHSTAQPHSLINPPETSKLGAQVYCEFRLKWPLLSIENSPKKRPFQSKIALFLRSQRGRPSPRMRWVRTPGGLFDAVLIQNSSFLMQNS